MLQRARRLAQERDRATASVPKPKAASVNDFTLRGSPLTRTLAWGVGRGQPASSMQKVAAAAVAESGVGNVNRSFSSICQASCCWGFGFRLLAYVFVFMFGCCRESLLDVFSMVSLAPVSRSGTAWAASLGASGKRTSHMEEAIHRAASRPSGDAFRLHLCRYVQVQNLWLLLLVCLAFFV